MRKKSLDSYKKHKKRVLPRPFIKGKPEWTEIHDKAWDLAAEHIRFKENIVSPYYMDEAHTDGQVWQWDTCFMAFYSLYAPSLFPGIESLDNFYSWQRDDGFIAMCSFFDNGQPVYGERINPQLFAWVEYEYYTFTGDSTRFEKVFRNLEKYYEWVKQNRRRDNIITPHSGDNNNLDGEGGGLYWSTCSGAMGADNSPRSQHLGWNGGELCWIDTSTYQALSALYLAKIAKLINNKKAYKYFTSEYNNLKELINRYMWSDRNQFYYDIFMDGNFTATKTILSFLPMLASIPDQSQAESLLSHLRNPHEFWRPHPLPTLSYDDPNYEDTGAYWLGGVWSPTNYMIARGLTQYGFTSTAHDIAVRHLNAMTQVYKEFSPHTIWEAYAPENSAIPATVKDKKSWCKPDFCGWSALGAINMLYENVIGITKKIPEKEISWNIILDTEHGIKNYPFKKGYIDLLYSPAKNNQNAFIDISNMSEEFNINITYRNQKIRRKIQKGENFSTI